MGDLSRSGFLPRFQILGRGDTKTRGGGPGIRRAFEGRRPFSFFPARFFRQNFWEPDPGITTTGLLLRTPKNGRAVREKKTWLEGEERFPNRGGRPPAFHIGALQSSTPRQAFIGTGGGAERWGPRCGFVFGARKRGRSPAFAKKTKAGPIESGNKLIARGPKTSKGRGGTAWGAE